jgi:hypothetical protein
MKIPGKTRLAKKHLKMLGVLIVITSLMSIALSPIDRVGAKIIANAPEILWAFFISETLFLLGILIMASRIGYELVINPYHWRKHYRTILKNIPEDTPFWVGFWINTVGALGTGVAILFGVVLTLPAHSWGISWVGFADLGITITVRSAVIELRREFE